MQLNEFKNLNKDSKISYLLSLYHRLPRLLEDKFHTYSDDVGIKISYESNLLYLIKADDNSELCVDIDLGLNISQIIVSNKDYEFAHRLGKAYENVDMQDLIVGEIMHFLQNIGDIDVKRLENGIYV